MSSAVDRTRTGQVCRAVAVGLPAAMLAVAACDGGTAGSRAPRSVVRLDANDRLEILPGITHALTRLATGDPAAIGPADVGTSVDPTVIDILTGWLTDIAQ